MVQNLYKIFRGLKLPPQSAKVARTTLSILIIFIVICHYFSITSSNNVRNKSAFSGSYRELAKKAYFFNEDSTVSRKSKDSIFYKEYSLGAGAYVSGWQVLVNDYKFRMGPENMRITRGHHIVLDTSYNSLRASERDLSFKIHSTGVLAFASIVGKGLYPSLPTEGPPVFLNSMWFELLAKHIEFEDLNFRHSSLFLTSNDGILLRNFGLKNSILFIDSAKYVILDGYVNNVQVKSNADFTALNHIQVDSSSFINFKKVCFISDISGSGKIRISKTNESPGELVLGDVDLNYLIISDPGIHLSVDTGLTDQAKINMYKQLIVKYEDLKDLKKEYDIGLQRLNYKISGDHFMPWVRESWDNFGYDKSLIFINSIYLMLFFFSINLLCYPKMIRSGYHLKEFATADTRIKAKYSNNWRIEMGTAFYCLVYTFFIFWGLKLNVEKLRVSNIGYTILILVQYFVGIVCLAYIANIVITR